MDKFESKRIRETESQGDGSGFTLRQFAELQKAYKIENPAAQKEIFEKHFNMAFLWLERYHNAVLAERDDETARRLVAENIEHTKRVVDLAGWLGEGEKQHISGGAYEQDQFVRKLKLAAIFHDIARLNPAEKGLIDKNYYKPSADLASGLLQLKIALTREVAHEIKQAIAAHDRDETVEPKTLLDYSLRDADILDQIDVWGLKKVVEESGDDDIHKVINATLENIRKNRLLIHTDTAKKIAQTFDKRRNEFLEFLKNRNVKNRQEFNAAFNDFIDSKIKK